MKTAYILTCKDLKRLLPFAAAWSVLMFISHAYEPDATNALHRSLLYANIAAWCAWVFVISLIVHESPPSGTTEFWMTRPISSLQLLASKFLIVFLLCVLLPVLILAVAKAAGLTCDALINGKEATVFSLFRTLCVAAMFFMLLATLTRSLGQYLLLIFGLFMIFSIFTFSLMRIESPGQRHVTQYRDVLEWMTSALFIFGIIFLIHNQYTRRNRKTTALLSALLALLIFCLWRFWPAIPKP